MTRKISWNDCARCQRTPHEYDPRWNDIIYQFGEGTGNIYIQWKQFYKNAIRKINNPKNGKTVH